MDNKNKYNSTVLHAELEAAGLDIDGCDSTGRVHWRKPPSEKELKTADDVLKTHNSTKLTERQSKIDDIKAKRRSGLGLAENEILDALDFLLGL